MKETELQLLCDRFFERSHQYNERLKGDIEKYIQSSLPSEQEIVSQVRHSTVDPDYIYGYEAGVRKVLELLTKGDR